MPPLHPLGLRRIGVGELSGGWEMRLWLALLEHEPACALGGHIVSWCQRWVRFSRKLAFPYMHAPSALSPTHVYILY